MKTVMLLMARHQNRFLLCCPNYLCWIKEISVGPKGLFSTAH